MNRKIKIENIERYIELAKELEFLQSRRKHLKRGLEMLANASVSAEMDRGIRDLIIKEDLEIYQKARIILREIAEL